MYGREYWTKDNNYIVELDIGNVDFQKNKLYFIEKKKSTTKVLKSISMKKCFVERNMKEITKMSATLKRHSVLLKIALEGKVQNKRASPKRLYKWDGNNKRWKKSSLSECKIRVRDCHYWSFIAADFHSDCLLDKHDHHH